MGMADEDCQKVLLSQNSRHDGSRIYGVKGFSLCWVTFKAMSSNGCCSLNYDLSELLKLDKIPQACHAMLLPHLNSAYPLALSSSYMFLSPHTNYNWVLWYHCFLFSYHHVHSHLVPAHCLQWCLALWTLIWSLLIFNRCVLLYRKTCPQCC